MDELLDTLDSIIREPAAQIAATVIGAVIVGRVIARILRVLFLRVSRRTKVDWDDKLAERLGGPVSTIVALQVFRIALDYLPLRPAAVVRIVQLIDVLGVVVVIWAGFRGIDIVRDVLSTRQWAIDRPASRSLLALGSRFSKVAVLILGVLVGLSQLGISIASLIAGLGIGGLVIALAAQKTVENVFGAVSIGIDQPMREGDFVKVYDFVGTVEQIGLRSTRIRTLDRTVITVPNGELANQRIESFSVRDRIRLATTIGLVYATTASQVREVIAGMTEVLRNHPKIWPDAVVVKFKEFAASSLDIEVMAWFQTGDWGEFQRIREDVLLQFMEVVEKAGTSIAFPTRTVHLINESAGPEATPRAAS